MQIVSNLHKMLKPFSVKHKKNISTCRLLKILPRMLSVKSEHVHLTIKWCVGKLLDEWQTMKTQIRRRVLRRLIGFTLFAQVCLSVYFMYIRLYKYESGNLYFVGERFYKLLKMQ